MKLRHLEIFHAVMTCGSLSRAAEALNILNVNLRFMGDV